MAEFKVDFKTVDLRKLYSNLKPLFDLNFLNNMESINFESKTSDKDKYFNLLAELTPKLSKLEQRLFELENSGRASRLEIENLKQRIYKIKTFLKLNS